MAHLQSPAERAGISDACVFFALMLASAWLAATSEPGSACAFLAIGGTVSFTFLLLVAVLATALNEDGPLD